MLPESLLCLLGATLAHAQARPQLSINSVASFNTLKLPQPPSFAIPQQQKLFISVAICSDSSPLPRFFVSNSSNLDTENDPGPNGGPDVFEIALGDGQGSWSGTFENGGIFAVEASGASGVDFDVGLSDSAAIHQTLNELPFFSDTTSNQAILFSPPFEPIAIVQPTYPNYTLPAANMSQPSPPANAPNFTLVLAPTSAGLASKPRTGCFLSAQLSSGTIANESLWMRDELGWRNQWLMGSLTPSTNYTAFVLQGATSVSGPIYFVTKSAEFTCPLVHSLPYCPGVAYAVPLPAPPSGSIAYDGTNLPEQLSAPLVSYIANFTTVLTTFACGRDWYSPIMGCDHCQLEYRKWLCSVSLTRCTEASASSTLAVQQQQQQPQGVFSAILPQQTTDQPRNPFMPQMGSAYDVLLPCLEQCNAVDRACPPFVGFKCPTARFNAAVSYGVGYIDGVHGDQDAGRAGLAQDRWGNVWCNMI